MNYRELLIKCTSDAKVKYPTSDFIQSYDVHHAISHLSVIDMFEDLAMLEYDMDEVIKWSDDVHYEHGIDYTDYLYNDMMDYFRLMKDMEV